METQFLRVCAMIWGISCLQFYKKSADHKEGNSCSDVPIRSVTMDSDSYCLQLDSQQPRFFKFTPHKVITCC